MSKLDEEVISARLRADDQPCALREPQSRWLRAWPWAAAMLSGVLLILSLSPYDQGWLGWISLTPLLGAIWFGSPAGISPWRAAALGYVTGFIYFTGAFWWLSTLAVLFQSEALRFIPPALGAYMGLYVALWAAFISRLPFPRHPGGCGAYLSSLRNLQTGALAACVWVVCEWVRGWLFSGFGWNDVGTALHQNLPMMQIVDLTGILGLSWLLIFSNVMAALIVRRIYLEIGPSFLKRIRWEFSATMGLIALVFTYGVHALLSPQHGTSVSLRFTAFQPNTPQSEKSDSDMEDALFARVKAQAAAAAISKKSDLLIWPESAAGRYFAQDLDFTAEMAGGTFSILIGALDADVSPKTGKFDEFNAAALVTGKGASFESYRKIHLVPYGEYLPMRGIMPWVLRQMVPGDFSAGTTISPMQLPNPPILLGPLICFEDTLGDLTRRFVKNGSEVLVNITNDGWFLRSAAARQHLANAVFRAVENRRPLIRCTNTGVTCSIDAQGRIDTRTEGGNYPNGNIHSPVLEPFQEGQIDHTISVPVAPPLTFYTRFGDWLAWASLIIAATSAAWRLVAHVKSKRRGIVSSR